jgi:hypothetical protein
MMDWVRSSITDRDRAVGLLLPLSISRLSWIRTAAKRQCGLAGPRADVYAGSAEELRVFDWP